MRIPPEATTSAMSDPVEWFVLIGFGLAWVMLAGLAVSIGLLVAVWQGGFHSRRSGAKRPLPRAG